MERLGQPNFFALINSLHLLTLLFMRTILFLAILALFAHPILGQQDQYRFARNVEQMQGAGWYRIPLLPDMFPYLSDGMSDLLLLGLGEDTLETPLTIHSQGYSKVWEGVGVKEVNQRNGKYIFRYDADASPNLLRVELSERNFDLNFQLEGSDFRLTWEPILSDVRLLGIVDPQVSFSKRDIPLPPVTHKYLRLSWEDPDIEVKSVALGKETITTGEYQSVPIRDWNMSTDTDRRLTTIRVFLPNKMPLSQLRLNLEDGRSEFVRMVDIKYVKQTITENDGSQKYLWRDWDRVVLHSFADPVFHLPQIFTDQLEITVYDQAELPLGIRGVEVASLAYEIRAMLSDDRSYEVWYGSQEARRVSALRSRAPEQLRTARLGPERQLSPARDKGEGEGNGIRSLMMEQDNPVNEWGKFALGFVVAVVLILGMRFIGKRRKAKR